MKISKKLTALLVAVMLIMTTAFPAFAASGVYKQNIYLPKNKIWTSAGDVSRSGNYSSVEARCHSVYPVSGTDTFTRVRCRVLNSAGTVISSVYTLNEANSSNTSIKIKEGYLSAASVTFQFSGNSSAAAYATVSYFGN